MPNEKTIEIQIITSATDLFLSKGFKSVTMDDLASNMGMSKKTIYTYFKTKNDLVIRVSNYLFDVINTGIDFICAQNRNPIEELFTINDFVQKNLKNEYTSPLHQLKKYYPKTHSELINKQFEIYYHCILANLKNGIQQDLYRKKLNIELVARIHFSSIIGIKDQDMFPKENFPVTKTIAEHLDYHIHGIANKKGIKILKKIQQKRK